ncbi:hypothetical protein BDW22DRAFT_1326168 [Trametopsis cervina]|nr:hypothetical protein BDW22DRAFT_1326168 [Trametopsis cervina]
MLFITLAWLAAAQTAFAAQFNVTVGGPGILKFDPPTVNASVGDVVLFTFKQSNHTATQSTFDNPCALAPNGFDSGFVPVSDAETGPFPAAQFIVEDTNPVWVYCRQANHCKQGMVFAINPGDKFPAFQAAAMGQSATSPSASVSAPADSSTPPAPSPPPAVSSTPQPPPPPQISPSSQQTSEAPSATSTFTPPTAASPSPSATGPTNHLIVVGGPNKLFFSPSNISAAVGDTITFEFHQVNHTATQSTFANPCRSLTDTSTSGQVGFDSGFMPVSDDDTNFPTFKVTVNDSSPIWAFCKQANHCGQGMVFSVNAVESGANNFATFQARAMQLNGTNTSNTSSANSASAGGKLVTATGLSSAGTVFALVFAILGLL